VRVREGLASGAYVAWGRWWLRVGGARDSGLRSGSGILYLVPPNVRRLP
jgi:hypothetical protein